MAISAFHARKDEEKFPFAVGQGEQTRQDPLQPIYDSVYGYKSQI